MLLEEKARLRAEMLARREALTDRAERDARIQAKVLALPEWEAARTICTYVGVGAEVATIPLIQAAFAAGKRIVVPMVARDHQLLLWRIESLDELAPAPFGLLEPIREVRRKHRKIVITVINLFLVPGLAFDAHGGRVGYGKGYYDRLLKGAKDRIPKVGLAFAPQLVDRVPVGPDDVLMNKVITD